MAATIVVATIAAYASLKSHTFLQFDDASYVTENGAVRAGLTAAGAQWAFSSIYAGNWHPLTWLSHMADVEWFGLDAGWHHLTSLALHILTTLLLLRVLIRMTGALGASAFVAAMFALHPLHVESVAWIAERKDVLSTLFWVVALNAYVTYVRDPKLWRYLIVALWFGMALLAKPMVVTLPFLLLLLDVWPLRRWQAVRATSDGQSAARLIREKLPLIAMAAAAAIVTFIVQRKAGAVQSLDVLPWSLRLAKIPVAYAHYVLSTIWPSGLSVLYPYPTTIPLWQSGGATILLLAITAGVLRWFRQRPYLLVGWLWFIGTLVPVIGIVQAGSQPYADRFMYVPAIGLFIMAAWGVAEWVSTRPVWVRPAVIAAVALNMAAAFGAWRQVQYWTDDITLWERTVAVTGDNYRAQTNLGFALMFAGQRNRAMVAYQDALRIKPDYPDAHNYLGSLFADMDDHDRAAAEFETAIKLRPRYALAHNNLGLSRVAQDRLADAITEFSTAIEIDPGFTPARNNRAIAYVHQEDYARAIPEFEEAVRRDPNSAESRMNLASALVASGRKREALPHFEAAAQLGGDPLKVHHTWGGVLMDLGDASAAAEHFGEAVRVNPRYAPAVHDFGRSLALSGRLNESIQALGSAVQMDPGNADYHHDFGAALARRGLIPQAIEEMRTALRIDPAHAEAQDALRILLTKK